MHGEAMSLETLLEAARYVEYRSEAKARGEEPHDYSTFSKLSAVATARDVSEGLSSSSEEVKAPLARDGLLTHEPLGTGTREVHNKLEKNRRAHLKECFEALKKQLPNMDDRKTSNLSILRGAIRYIQTLKRKERDYEQDMERLAREKISFQQRLSLLRKDFALQLDQPEDDNETTTTASECGLLSDFDDILPRENHSAAAEIAPPVTTAIPIQMPVVDPLLALANKRPPPPLPAVVSTDCSARVFSAGNLQAVFTPMQVINSMMASSSHLQVSHPLHVLAPSSAKPLTVSSSPPKAGVATISLKTHPSMIATLQLSRPHLLQTAAAAVNNGGTHHHHHGGGVTHHLVSPVGPAGVVVGPSLGKVLAAPVLKTLQQPPFLQPSPVVVLPPPEQQQQHRK